MAFARFHLPAVLIAALLMFSGCSSLPQIEWITSTTEIKQPDPTPPLPNPRPIETAPFKWRVITSDRLPKGEGWVYYGITPKQYEILSKNMADILRWVKEAQWRLDYYRGEGLPDGHGTERNEGDNGSD